MNKNKIILTSLAMAVMVFGFNVTPSHAGDEDGCTHLQKSMGTCHTAQVNEVQDLNEAVNESEVADSGDEGSTSAAQESDQ